MKTIPDYKRIYTDIVVKKYPHKIKQCEELLNKKVLSVIDVIHLNEKIFGITDKQTLKISQQHRSYDTSDILQILDYQKKHRLNNSQLARHFRLSRNSVAKWKKMFLV